MPEVRRAFLWWDVADERASFLWERVFLRRSRLLRVNVSVQFGLGALAAAACACTPFAEDDSAPACDLTKPFGTPSIVPGFERQAEPNSPGALRLSPDLLVGYYDAYGPGEVFTNLYFMTRPTLADPFAFKMSLFSMPPSHELHPTVSGDGLTLLFEQSPQDDTTRHLYSARRASVRDSFADAELLSSVDSSGIAGVSDFSAFLREDGQALYFASNRASPGSADNDIYRCPAFGSPLPVNELNSSADDEAPVVTPNDLTMYFASTRPPSDGGLRVWTAKRASTSEPFSTPAIVKELNEPGTTLLPTFVTRDGCTLYLEGSLLSSVQWTVYVAQKPR